MTVRTLIVAAALTCLVLATTESEARRVGVARPATGQPAAGDDQKNSGSRTPGAAKPADTAPSVDELTRKRNEELARVRKRIDDDAKMRKADQDRKREDDAERALEAQRRRDAQEAEKRAAAERAREARRRERERQEQCVVKPVMSDEDIARCRAARGG